MSENGFSMFFHIYVTAGIEALSWKMLERYTDIPNMDPFGNMAMDNHFS